ncbi:hypothetical protein AB0G02_10220 [Actinosynnema sp. NPDC023658]|uniref:hypothetical protein n=1 Tax=Actinosynnema sp. NPDC023658 TaxID=3155465 RepID=UPI0033FC2F81
MTQHSFPTPTPDLRAVTGMNLDDSVCERLAVPRSRVGGGIVTRTTSHGAPQHGSAAGVVTRAGQTTTN